MYDWAYGNANDVGPQGQLYGARRSVYQAIPTDFMEARVALGDRRYKRLGYATELRREDASFALIHHRTAIVVYNEDDSVRVTTGGYYSATTKARLNAALRGSPWSLGTERGVWYWYRFDSERCERFCEYADGDRVYLAPGLPGRDGIFA